MAQPSLRHLVLIPPRRSVAAVVRVTLIVDGLAHVLLQLACVFLQVPSCLFHMISGDLADTLLHSALDLVFGTLNAILVHAASPLKACDIADTTFIASRKSAVRDRDVDVALVCRPRLNALNTDDHRGRLSLRRHPAAILPACSGPPAKEPRMLHVMLLTLAMAVSTPINSPTLPNRPVPTLDLDRYAGEWHEIAHLPMYFQRKCVGAVIARYTPRADGTIHIHNACETSSGRQTVDGVAKIEDDQPAVFKVRFAPAWLSWLPRAWADYWVIEVSPDYQWAVIGSPSRKYLWILSRRPDMQRALFESIKHHARQRGYAVEKLVLMAPLN
jgi:apolipoprotein D and lipocalin family protein